MNNKSKNLLRVNSKVIPDKQMRLLSLFILICNFPDVEFKLLFLILIILNEFENWLQGSLHWQFDPLLLSDPTNQIKIKKLN